MKNVLKKGLFFLGGSTATGAVLGSIAGVASGIVECNMTPWEHKKEYANKTSAGKFAYSTQMFFKEVAKCTLNGAVIGALPVSYPLSIAYEKVDKYTNLKPV